MKFGHGKTVLSENNLYVDVSKIQHFQRVQSSVFFMLHRFLIFCCFSVKNFDCNSLK